MDCSVLAGRLIIIVIHNTIFPLWIEYSGLIRYGRALVFLVVWALPTHPTTNHATRFLYSLLAFQVASSVRLELHTLGFVWQKPKRTSSALQRLVPAARSSHNILFRVAAPDQPALRLRTSALYAPPTTIIYTFALS